jgi:hypothetical protein
MMHSFSAKSRHQRGPWAEKLERSNYPLPPLVFPGSRGPNLRGSVLLPQKIGKISLQN